MFSSGILMGLCCNDIWFSHCGQATHEISGIFFPASASQMVELQVCAPGILIKNISYTKVGITTLVTLGLNWAGATGKLWS